MTKRELASGYFKQGYNCAQSVVLAFKDGLNLDDRTLLAVASSFGGGMGRLREVCGEVSGAFIVLGLKYGYVSADDYFSRNHIHENLTELGHWKLLRIYTIEWFENHLKQLDVLASLLNDDENSDQLQISSIQDE